MIGRRQRRDWQIDELGKSVMNRDARLTVAVSEHNFEIEKMRRKLAVANIVWSAIVALLLAWELWHGW